MFIFGQQGDDLNPSKGRTILRGPWSVPLRKAPKFAESRLVRRRQYGKLQDKEDVKFYVSAPPTNCVQQNSSSENVLPQLVKNYRAFCGT